MQIGRSYRVGSIKGDLDRLKLHSALIRQPAAMLNKWKFLSVSFLLCVCVPCVTPRSLSRTLILHLIFSNSHCFRSLCISAFIPLHLSSHADSLSPRILAVVSNQGNHSQRATNRSLIWCLVWSDWDRQPVKSLASASPCYFKCD